MDVTFASKKLEKTFNSEKALRGEYGPRMAEKIMARLLDLQGAANLAVMRLLPGRCHELRADMPGHLALDLVQPQRLVFRPNHDPEPRNDSGTLIWELVTNVTIVGVGNYHS